MHLVLIFMEHSRKVNLPQLVIHTRRVRLCVRCEVDYDQVELPSVITPMKFLLELTFNLKGFFYNFFSFCVIFFVYDTN